MLLALAIAAYILFVGRMLAQGTFAEDCSNLSLCGNVLHAACKNDAGVAHDTTFDLDTCIGHGPAGPWCFKDVAFPIKESCQQCALNSTTLWCVCIEDTDIGLEWDWNSFNLDGCINVNNGQLSCVDF